MTTPVACVSSSFCESGQEISAFVVAGVDLGSGWEARPLSWPGSDGPKDKTGGGGIQLQKLNLQS